MFDKRYYFHFLFFVSCMFTNLKSYSFCVYFFIDKKVKV